MPELRRDPIIGRWVIVATEREKRPSDFKAEVLDTDSKNCPFCPGNESFTPPEILSYREVNTSPDSPGWWTRVVPNKFPALQIEGELDRQAVGIYDKMNGIGAHEVIIDSPDHIKGVADLEDHYVEKIIWAYRDRILDLKKDSRFKYILVFKNYGKIAGATIAHPHSQLIATPIVPKRVKEELKGSLQYYRYKERCIFCDIVRQEIKEKERVIIESEHFLSFAPYASRFPFEICIIPKKHRAEFILITSEEVVDLAKVLKSSLAKIKNALANPAYNYILHNVPTTLREDLEDYHWHIEIIPKLVNVAGFEWGSGFYINPTPPEDAAIYLRES
jgi:UDPglucose--hexose-1-phosphate uridylyltransferase